MKNVKIQERTVKRNKVILMSLIQGVNKKLYLFFRTTMCVTLTVLI